MPAARNPDRERGGAARGVASGVSPCRSATGGVDGDGGGGDRVATSEGDAVRVSAVRSVVLVGLFSAKDRDYQARLDALEARVTALGGQVLGRFAQRRGVSDGGVRLMATPLSRRFLIRRGKLEQIAAACSSMDIDAVVFINDLNDYQRRWLSTRLERPVLTQADLDRPVRSLASLTRSQSRARQRSTHRHC
ncbi:hypothetical protein ACGF5C_11750 [Micromonospora sp. NPDC047620]|uniref:HflX-like GTP-binding protein n=1 Tax=Micromonospora sp. NPDC047620 TaxID=3364251 RepID=UPI00371EB0D2